ncbi:lysozyme [Hymenobacter pini]|uniref:lysozyme n=1 Tax=Hymenobacter pini TaxID=2880879 RepID=UPI001CF1BACB|nr:lysozyme [Hymenobacter pini]MCA8831966.1 lysozyme [Hymenobacter pini]
MMQISDAGLALIKREEKFMARRYYCEAKKPTIGYGHVILPAEQHLNTATLTEPQASDMLRKDVAAKYGAHVSNSLTRVPTQNQFDAMVSLCFNIGTGGFTQSSVLRMFNAGVTDAAAYRTAFGAWNKITVNGQKIVSKGLTLRRGREADLFLKA